MSLKAGLQRLATEHRGACTVGLLDHHHRIRAIGNHASGMHQRSLSWAEPEQHALAHGRLSDHIQVRWHAARRSVGIRRPDRVSINGATDERGQLVRCDCGLSQHPVLSINHRDSLGQNDGLEVGGKHFPRFFTSKQIQELSHGLATTSAEEGEQADGKNQK